ncbi:MAG: type II toxin-antitoxin system VapC family toxin [Anaerovoracaceae bacterium]
MIVIDTNVLLDVILYREKHFDLSYDVYVEIIKCNLDAGIVATSMTDIFFIVKRKQNHQKAKAAISDLLTRFSVLEVGNTEITNALNSKIVDYEDAVIEQVAIKNKAEYIITRDLKDFKNSKVKAISPEEFLKMRGAY